MTSSPDLLELAAATAVKAARGAAAFIQSQSGRVQEADVRDKGVNDFASYVDEGAQQIILEAIEAAFPDHHILAEEGFVESGQSLYDIPGYLWIVDPLDGTTNFLHGIPHFAISIAVEEPLYGGNKREVTTGLIYQPVTDESYWAEKSRGAWGHDQRLRVSARRDMADCVIATGIPFMGHGDMAQWTRIFGAVAPSIAGIRRFGAAALDLAHVASGRYDGYWESGLQPWDVAAGMLLVREAGGFVSDFRGGEQMIERREVIAGNDAIHSKLHKLVAGALR